MKNYLKTTLLLACIILFYSCKKNDPAPSDSGSNIVPTQFSIQLPSSISASSSSGAKMESAFTVEDDTLHGEQFYELLRGYIWFGHASAQIVEDIIVAIRVYNLSKPTSVYFKSDEDDRMKSLVVTESATYEGITYSYKLVMKDSLSGKIGLQVFWNTSPISGIAILKPYDLNRTTLIKDSAVVYRVDYSEVATDKYDRTMLVQASGIVTTGEDLNAIKMFVGAKGDVLSIYGNSNHPNISTLSLGGINFAFRAKANKTTNVSAAEVALPPNTLTGIAGLYNDYSFKKVFIAIVKKVFPSLSESAIAKYIKNADAPGFFKSGGFVSAQTPPTADGTLFDDVKDLSDLEPYVPVDIKNLSVQLAK